MREKKVHDWALEQDLGWDSSPWGFRLVLLSPAEAEAALQKKKKKGNTHPPHTHPHTHTLSQKAVWSPTRSTKRISSGTRGHSSRTVSWGRCKRIYGIVDENSRNANAKHNTRGPTHRHTHGCTEKRWVNRWYGQEKEIRGQNQEKAENTRNMQPTFPQWMIWLHLFTSYVLMGCIMLHSVSALFVRVSEMKQVVTSFSALCDKKGKFKGRTGKKFCLNMAC